MEVLNFLSNFVCLVFLTAQFYFAVSQEMFTIIRNPGDGNPWTDLDEFKLPDSKCHVQCTRWNPYSVRSQDCRCECSYNQEATFGFYSGSWKCLDNTEVRKQTGNLCRYKFQYEQDTYPLRILEQGAQQNASLPSPGCSVDQVTSRYFTCDGRWAGIESQSFGQWFSIQCKGSSANDRHIYEVKIGSSIGADLLGRIISLNIRCGEQENSCLLFKLNGTFQCAENATSIITSSSSAIPSPTTPATATATSSMSAPKTTAKPNDNGKNEKGKASGSLWIVVGIVVTLVIIVIIVIVIVTYVYRKRKRGESVDHISSCVRKTRSTQSKKTVGQSQEELEYAEIPEEQRRNEPVDQAGDISYDYAFAADSSPNDPKPNYDFKDRNLHDFMLKTRDANKRAQDHTQRGSEGRHIESEDLGYVNDKEMADLPSSREEMNGAAIPTDNEDFVPLSNEETAKSVYEELKHDKVMPEYQSLDNYTRKGN